MIRNVFRLTAISAAAAAALATGCGGGPTVDTTTYCGKAAVVVCANMFACCTGEERAAKLGELNVNDENKCQQDMAVSCEISLATTLYAVDKGTVKYDEPTATQCIDAMKHPDKECALVADVAPYADACKDSPFQGTIAAGSECNWSFECVKGASCDSGKCKAPPAEGENCSVTCAEGLYCKTGKCAQLLASGTVCTSSYECQTSLYCGLPTTTATEKKCLALKAAGTECTADSECDTSDCGSGTCSSDGSSCTSDWDCDGTCKKAGTSCTSDWNCSTSYCEKSGTTCTSATQCDTATNEQCIDDTCVDATCGSRKCASKPLVTFDYCKLVN